MPVHSSGGINQVQVDALGCMLFSVINASCTISTRALYIITVKQSTGSLMQAVTQFLFLTLPDIVDVIKNARRFYTNLSADRMSLDVVITQA